MLELIQKTFIKWNADKAPQLAAALAFYTILSIPALLIIALAVAGYFYNADMARSQLIAQLSGFVDTKTAGFIQSMLENSTRTSAGRLSPTLRPFADCICGKARPFLHVSELLGLDS